MNVQLEQDISTASTNNRGVELMRCGNMSQAIDCFRLALQGSLEQCAGGDDSDHHEAHQCRKNSFSTYWKNTGNFTRCIAPLPLVLYNDESTYQYLHTQGIYLIPQPGAYVATDPLANTSVVTSIILYNLALLFHFKGLEGSDKASRARLSKARSLYIRSRALLENAAISTTEASGCIVVDYLCMAVLNNLGYAAYQLDDYNGSKACFKDLVHFTASMAAEPTYQHHHETPLLSTTQLQRHAPLVMDAETHLLLEQSRAKFLLNAMSLRRPNFAAAA